MPDPAKIPIRASSQAHLDIEDIQDNLVILKDGGCVLILATTAINFGLLSEKEQDATIYAYAALINSLTFSVQIVIRSQKKDVSGYLKLLEEAEAKEKKSEIKEQIQKYKGFISEIVTKNEVLDKKFYLAIPMTALELGAKQALGSLAKPRKKLPFPKDYILEKGKTNLYPKRDHLLKQLARLGLNARQLNTQELIKLFFEIYNPGARKQPVGQTNEYQTPIVQSSPIKPEPPEPSPPKPTVSQVSKPKPSPLPSSPSPIPPVTNHLASENSLQNEINHLVTKSTQPK